MKVRFGLEGERLDPDAVVRHIGVPGSISKRAGELVRPGLSRRYSSCHWTVGPEATCYWEPLLVQLLDRLRPLERFREIATAFEAKVFVSVVSEIYGDLFPDQPDFAATTPAHHVSPEVVADLAAAGASIDIDEYIFVDDRPDDDRPEEERTTRWAKD